MEGTENWQALWTSAGYFLLAATLWQARCKEGNVVEADWYGAAEPGSPAPGIAPSMRTDYLATRD
jgi:hypothetical protein